MTEPIELQTHVIDGHGAGPRLLITGGVHGDEFEPMAAIRRLIGEIAAREVRGHVTLIPVVNESAFQRQQRCGVDGLDLARTCPGRVDGSITEQTAFALSQLIRAADYYIDLHTGGTKLCISPLTGYMLHADPTILAQQREMARAFNLPIVWGTSAALEGRSLSVARDAEVPAIYAEYGGAAACNPDGVSAYVEGCLNVMAAIGMIDRQSQPSRIVHQIEDDRPQSGHLQIQNPAPCDGYFEARVSLGQPVTTGDLLGVVVDELGQDRVDLQATQSGIVLVLRTFPRANQGDGLAVILEA